MAFDEPMFPPIADDLAESAAATYGDENPDDVSTELTTQASLLAEVADEAGSDAWSRGLTIGDTRSDVRRLLEQRIARLTAPPRRRRARALSSARIERARAANRSVFRPAVEASSSPAVLRKAVGLGFHDRGATERNAEQHEQAHEVPTTPAAPSAVLVVDHLDLRGLGSPVALAEAARSALLIRPSRSTERAAERR